MIIYYGKNNILKLLVLKGTEKSNQLKCAIIVSAILHIILIALLIWTSYPSLMDISSRHLEIDAVMVDYNTVVEQYNHQEQSKENRFEQFHQNQPNEQKHLKALEKERLQREKNQKQKNQKKTEQQKKTKFTSEAVKEEIQKYAKSSVDINKKFEKETNKQISSTKNKVEKEAKVKTVSDMQMNKKTKEQSYPDTNKQFDAVDNFFNDLASSKKTSTQSDMILGTRMAKPNNEFNEAIDNYGNQLRSAIQNKFYDWQLYQGKTCTLRIILAPDGLLISVEAASGNLELCQAAVTAAKQARLPKPPSPAVYEAFKNVPIDFKP